MTTFEARSGAPLDSTLPVVRDEARLGIEVARQRAIEIDRALAQLRANLREASALAGETAVAERGVSAELDPATAYRWLLLDGHEAACRGRLVEAAAIFEDAVRRAPRRAEGHLNLGRTHLRLGRFEDARQSFERVLALEPGNEAASAGVADCVWRAELPPIEPEPVQTNRRRRRFLASRRPESRRPRRAH